MGESSNISSYPKEKFGNSPEMATQLSNLVCDGKKTATSSLLWCYDNENEPLPKVGKRLCLLDGQDIPVCVLEVTRVEIKAFNEVGVEVALAEGEGDLSLIFWKSAHESFFKGECSHFSGDMDVVTEWFKVIEKF